VVAAEAIARAACKFPPLEIQGPAISCWKCRIGQIEFILEEQAMEISFHGADREVTGSCHLVTCNGKRILVDCGMFQGGHELEEENRRPFGFDPATIDFLLLTHAHLDHCGRIPLLVKQGFRGQIITTSASHELAKLVLLDAAGLQEKEAEWRSRKVRRHGGKRKKSVVEPLYTVLDVLDTMDYFDGTAGYNKPMQLAEGIRVTFIDAGHILGSASLLLELEEEGRTHRLLMSGDLGYNHRVILRNPAKPPKADTVVIETTYGNRRHKALRPSVAELYQAIEDTFLRGGNVIIPTFALERAQEILYFLREGVEQGILPASMQVFLDSPMAISATEIFRRHPECFDKETFALFKNGQDPFDLPGLHFTRETAESIALNQVKGGAVIMAGSGMCTGGRIRHHLKHNLWRPESSVVFVGYAAKGTLARRIVDGARSVKIFGEEIPVEARIHTIGGFSAHADCDELFGWYRQSGTPELTVLVHGEEEAMSAFARRLGKARVVMPEIDERIEL
jgi:metallo-beta-lactamase family protein